VRTLRDFFFDVLDIELNQTPKHKTDLPMKKNQSLSYAIDFDLHFNLYKELTKYVSLYDFIEFEHINDGLKSLHLLMPEYGEKPVAFRLVINNAFQDLHYNYSGDNLYTFMNFEFGGRKFSLPIEKIAQV
jgi:hypothetical protein